LFSQSRAKLLVAEDLAAFVRALGGVATFAGACRGVYDLADAMRRARGRRIGGSGTEQDVGALSTWTRSSPQSAYLGVAAQAITSIIRPSSTGNTT